MYLKELKLTNFRSFSDLTIPLCADLSVLVGENNGGKSNAIDAIRLLTMPLSGRRELYCEPSDVRFGSAARRFEVAASFSDMSPLQRGRMQSAAIDDTLETAMLGLTYDETKSKTYTRPSVWGGKFKQPAEAGAHENVRHVYLPPLRDAKRALASGNPTRIFALLKHFLGTTTEQELAKALSRSADSQILTKVDDAVEVGLHALTSGVRRQVASLGFAENEGLIEIARDLRFKLADHGVDPEELRYSGHGYANLLYMATIAVELENLSDADLTLFLVEEPEAHLHPQLQAAVLCFLEEQAEKSNKQAKDAGEEKGQLQVLVATHSPNLSAWVPNKHVVFFRSYLPTAAPVVADVHTPASALGVEAPSPTAASPTDAPSEPANPEPGEIQITPRRETRCIPLNALKLKDEERRKIDRYLDVTKSALLFGGRVLLVEGIAEALLLPVIAKHHVLKGDADRYRTFRSTVFVPIDGVDFEPYVRLLLSPYEDARIADRVVVLTDGDRTPENEGKPSPGDNRKTTLGALAKELKADGLSDIVVNTYSLETELFLAGNADLLKAVYLKLHKLSGDKWDAAVAKSGHALAKAIQGLFEDTRKGDFAQILADRIAEGEPFAVPAYLKRTIELIVE